MLNREIYGQILFIFNLNLNKIWGGLIIHVYGFKPEIEESIGCVWVGACL